MARALVSLVLKPSESLPGLEEIKTYLATEFWRQVPGFRVLQAEPSWGDGSLDLLGRDSSGKLIALFVSVSRDDRAYRSVIANALIASTWVEENRAEAGRLYGDQGVDLEHPLRTILVAPGPVSVSRVLARAAEKAGVEVLPYAIHELESGEGTVRAVSFASPSLPAPPATALSRPSPAGAITHGGHEAQPPLPAAPRPRPVEQAVEPIMPDATRPETPRRELTKSGPEPKAEATPGSTVEAFVASLSDRNLKALSEQVLTFLLSRFPTATGAALSPNVFALTNGSWHLATIHLEKDGAAWLEVGPDKILTNRIKDPAMLERALKLPSVLMALDSLRAARSRERAI